MTEVWYRATVDTRSSCDPFDEDIVYTAIEVTVSPYKVLRTTPKGVWLAMPLGGSKFVLGKAKRQFAQPTIELAWRDEVQRRMAHVRGEKARLKQAEDLLRHAEVQLQDLIRHNQPERTKQ